MSDIRLVQQPLDITGGLEAVTMDFLLTPAGQLDVGEDLATALRVALGTDGLAAADELSFEDDGDRRGWWGDLDAEIIWDGWPIGCKLWLLRRERLSDVIVARAEAIIREACQPFIDHRICSDVLVDLTRAADAGGALNRLTGTVTLVRGPAQRISQRFDVLWNDVKDS